MSKTDDLSQSDSTLGVFVRGLLMGVAELVPGVSGGTIAFISSTGRILRRKKHLEPSWASDASAYMTRRQQGSGR